MKLEDNDIFGAGGIGLLSFGILSPWILARGGGQLG